MRGLVWDNIIAACHQKPQIYIYNYSRRRFGKLRATIYTSIYYTVLALDEKLGFVKSVALLDTFHHP
jgi:hypothetical protein